MSYYTQSLLAQDTDLASRVTACAALEQIPSPDGWAYSHNWQLSAQPGWDAAYASAIAGGIEHPGRDEGVIPDAWILTAVQQIRQDEEAPA